MVWIVCGLCLQRKVAQWSLERLVGIELFSYNEMHTRLWENSQPYSAAHLSAWLSWLNSSSVRIRILFLVGKSQKVMLVWPSRCSHLGAQKGHKNVSFAYLLLFFSLLTFPASFLPFFFLSLSWKWLVTSVFHRHEPYESPYLSGSRSWMASILLCVLTGWGWIAFTGMLPVWTLVWIQVFNEN